MSVLAGQRRLALVGFGIALLLAWASYRPALDGAFQLDDVGNLAGLAGVTDAGSALDFILAGDAGPTGRPVALATFALQASHWEEGPRAFLTFNILLHLCNAVILAWCLRMVALQARVEAERATVIAVAAAGLWVLLPLLASATLLVVQRMTLLSATFVLLGLAGYLAARSRIEQRPVAALLGMSASLVLATALATLSKESGILLPVFVLALEATVLERPRQPEGRLWRAWQGLFLVLPLLALLGYLSTLLSYPESLELRRGFDPAQRLLTETRVLWIYLGKAILGLPQWLGVFQSPPALSRGLFEPATLAAVLGWLIVAGFALAWRRRKPLLSLAVFWFLGGHLIESTVVPLEIYFEHRNYLPIVGPVFALAFVLLTASVRIARYAGPALVVVLLCNAFLVYRFASLAGEPSQAARYWALHYPDSGRAVTNLASFQLREESALQALQTIDQFALREPGYAYLRIQELNLRCMVMPQADHELVIRQLTTGLPQADFTYTAGTMLSELFDTVAAGNCSGVDSGTVVQLAEALRSNPRYAQDRGYNQFHYRLLAAVARHGGAHAESLQHLHTAISYRPSSELNMMMVTALGSAGDFDGALEFISAARDRAPGNFVRSLRWQRDLDGLQAYIHELRQHVEREQPDPSATDPENGTNE